MVGTCHVNPIYREWVNNLSSGFTKFELMTFTPLSSRASQEIFLQIRKGQYLEDGVFLSADTIRKRLGIKYKIKDITNKIIKPAVREINWNNSFGREINYETVRNVVGYRFFFEANSPDEDSPF